MTDTATAAPSSASAAPTGPAPAGPADMTPPRVMTLSASAARRVRKLAEMEGGAHVMMRLTVSGGGCSGFQYGFSFDATLNDDDHVFERDGARLVVDDTSLDLLGGAEVDFVEELAGSYFKVNNPNASSSCGCGQSFSL